MTTPSFNYNDWQERITAYISQKMNDTDRQVFEAHMTEIAELKQAVALDSMLKRKGEVIFLAEYAKANFGDFMDGDSPESTGEKTPETPLKEIYVPKSPGFTPLSIKGILGSLGIVFLSIVGYFGFQYQAKQAKKAELMRIEKEWFPHLAFNGQFTNLKDSAVQLYNDTLYEQAEILFLKNDAANISHDGPYGFYRAINALMLNPPKTDLALAILKVRLPLNEKQTFEIQDVRWYMVLAYLQKQNYKAAKEVLVMIPQGSKYENNARKLILLLYDLP
jgi:hypothetical protein